MVGIGTETDGSIVCPGSAAGLVGVKPTVGLVSRSGIIPISTADGASDFQEIDPLALSPFTGTHPAAIRDWLATEAEQRFALNPEHRLTRRERKHRLSMQLERVFGWDLSHKHYRLVA